MQDFEGKVAVVTGAASGIGQALAERFAREKMRVVLVDIEQPALSSAAGEMESNGATVAAVSLDVSKAADVETLAGKVYSRFGAVHVLCNNAGVGGVGGPAWQQSLEAWNWVLGVNLFGVIHGIRSFVPRMLAGGEEGHIVNTASLAGLLSGPLIAPYFVSKHGVVALSESLYLELQAAHAPQLGVSVLCPGLVKTRIAESVRNAPPGSAIQSSAEMQQQLRGLLEQFGAPPARIADQVLAAICNREFWILTHPEYNPAIRARAEGMLQNRNPEMLQPPAPANA